MQKRGESILYGDATYHETLRQAGIERARILVITIPEAACARRTVKIARDLNPAVHIIVRTLLVNEVEELYKLRANEVVPEEFETSIEFFSRVSRTYKVPTNIVDKLIRETRKEGYELFRIDRQTLHPLEGVKQFLAEVDFEIYSLDPESSMVGKTIAEAGIKKQTGCMVLAVHRQGKTTPNPPADWQLEPNDIVLLMGHPDSLSQAGAMLQGS